MIEKNQASWWQPGILIFARLSGWIGGPVLIAVFAGKWLDQKYDSEPWLFLGSVGIAFAVSIVGIVKEALGEMKKIEKESAAKKAVENEEENKEE